MRKFQITSPTLNGEITIAYNDNDVLCCIDMNQCIVTSTIASAVLRKLPLTVQQLTEYKWNEGTLCIEVDVVISFDDFWKDYPMKVNKKRCIKIWDSLPKHKQVKATNGIVPYKKHLRKNEWKECKSPDTYLRNESWEDEYR